MIHRRFKTVMGLCLAAFTLLGCTDTSTPATTPVAEGTLPPYPAAKGAAGKGAAKAPPPGPARAAGN